MSPRFKAKELLFLLLPVLGFAGFAFYLTRAGSGASGGLGMFGGKMFSRGPYIESVKFETALGDKREQGFSHTVTVTLNHSWPKPAHWNNCCAVYQIYDAFDRPLPTTKSLLAPTYVNRAAALGETVWKHEGKSSVIGQKQTGGVYGRLEQQGGRFTFTRNLALQNAGTQGSIELNDTYIIAGQEVINLHKVLRKVGDKLPFDTSRITGGTLLSASANSWQGGTNTSTPIGSKIPKTTNTDGLDIDLKIQCPRSANGTVPGFNIYDVKLVDGKGRVYSPVTSNFLLFSPKAPVEEPPSGKYQLSPHITLGTGSGFRPLNPLTLSGKVSIDHQWPLPFSIKLPRLL